VSDLFGGTDPGPLSTTITVTRLGDSDGFYIVALEVAESTSRRRHRETVHVPRELLADVLDATAWWAHLAWVSQAGGHKSVPKKWQRRTAGRVTGWARRAR